jgi:dihydrofolate reductase
VGKVITQASMSLDGYIADPAGNVGPLFDWYGNGDVEVTGADPDRVFKVSAVFVVTHRPPEDWDFPDAPFTFVPEGVERAVALAKELAGDRYVSVCPGNVGGQAFQAGLVDEVLVDLVPAVFGAGVGYFGDYAGSPLLLENPEIVQGDRVTHLRHRVRRPGGRG